ncbi:hypothetical protein CVT26_008911 [Gymnopilus dilepis]|uniref:PAS domain-containing protein n=1 Tax=Gymnopilus dilepis TaxID=231916 RepID=A0A409YRS8_9AGAR|nr:hypothetical protein CVT26_008911 [Gymnopilus dilepis]
MNDNQLQVCIPSFLYSSLPSLAPGGSAEAIPVDCFSTTSFARSSSLQHQWPVSRDEQQQQVQEQYSNAAPFEYASIVNPPEPVHCAPSKKPDDLSIFAANVMLPAPFTIESPFDTTSGIDVLSILDRIANAPDSHIVLGPMRFSCAFVVVDVRQQDHPVVYCSPTFCALTGFKEEEIIGRNCRFLQAPGGNVKPGSVRQNTSQEAVAHMRKNMMKNKECQTILLNYKKNGDAFYNLVTIIPVPGGQTGEENNVVYHVGFQVSLNEQMKTLLEKHRDGGYIVNYATKGPQLNSTVRHIDLEERNCRSNLAPPVVMSKELKRLLGSSSFLQSFPIPASAHLSTTNTAPANYTTVTGGANHLLHLFLLEVNPDFYHVLSLSGSLLYVAPSVRRVLGYDSEEMVGKSIADYVHPDDVAPLMRELKESSATGVMSLYSVASSNYSLDPSVGNKTFSTANKPSSFWPEPRPIDLLYRAKTKMGRYVWVQCRGRLHMERGKGRKAIILVGRAKEMMTLKWEDVNCAGGLATKLRIHCHPHRHPLVSRIGQAGRVEVPGATVWAEFKQEVWGMLGGTDQKNATFLSVGQSMRDVLGWASDDLLGSSVLDIVADEGARNIIAGFVLTMRTYQRRHYLLNRLTCKLDGARWKKVQCRLKKKDGGMANVWFVLYRADPDLCEETVPIGGSMELGSAISPAHLVYQIRLVGSETVLGGSGLLQPFPYTDSPSQQAPPSPSTPDWQSVDLFEELAVEKQSNWQYELEKLRIANAKILEELMSYKDIEQGNEGILEGGAWEEQAQVMAEELFASQTCGRVPYGATDGYEPALIHGPFHSQSRRQPLYSTQQLWVASRSPSPPIILPPHPSEIPEPLPPSLSRLPYLYRPQLQLLSQNMPQGLPDANFLLERCQQQPRTIFPGLSSPEWEQFQQEWDLLTYEICPLRSSGLPLALPMSHNPKSHIRQGIGSLKRPWHAMYS